MGVTVASPLAGSAGDEVLDDNLGAENNGAGEFRAFWEDFISATDETHEHIVGDVGTSQGAVDPLQSRAQSNSGMLASICMSPLSFSRVFRYKCKGGY